MNWYFSTFTMWRLICIDLWFVLVFGRFDRVWLLLIYDSLEQFCINEFKEQTLILFLALLFMEVLTDYYPIVTLLLGGCTFFLAFSFSIFFLFWASTILLFRCYVLCVWWYTNCVSLSGFLKGFKYDLLRHHWHRTTVSVVVTNCFLRRVFLLGKRLR